MYNLIFVIANIYKSTVQWKHNINQLELPDKCHTFRVDYLIGLIFIFTQGVWNSGKVSKKVVKVICRVTTKTRMTTSISGEALLPFVA